MGRDKICYEEMRYLIEKVINNYIEVEELKTNLEEKNQVLNKIIKYYIINEQIMISNEELNVKAINGVVEVKLLNRGRKNKDVVYYIK